tara:strand:- start:219 stop:1700 length:1482 start_codon:yes stop_codon:yes gene_type:complete
MKQIIKNFNNLIKRTIFKVQNKTNNNFNISNFNKYLIAIIASLFIYLFYLLIPLLYDKTWVQDNIERKVLSEFKINLNTTSDISYRILPAPHFLIKDSKILVKDGEKKKSIAEIRYLKVFLSQKNFFDFKKMKIKELLISSANFSFLRSDLKLLDKLIDKKFSNNKIMINNSNIFFKDNLGEIISIIKIDKTVSFFDNKKLLNSFNLEGEVFNIPFVFDFYNRNDSAEYKEIYLSSKLLKLNVFNKSTIKKKITSGENNISFLNSRINTTYDTKDKLIIFNSNNSKLGNSRFSYGGELSINPFDLNLNIRLKNHKISKLLNINPVLIEFFKSGLIFNDNISIKTFIIATSDEKKEIFQSAKINLNIVNGKLNLDKTTFVNDSIGLLELSNSNLFLENNNLFFSTDILFIVKNSDNLFSFLNTSKQSRKDIKNILINLSYDFLSNKIKFNNVKINNKVMNNQLLSIIDSFNDNNSNNIINSRRLLNKLLSIYEG